MMQIPLSISQWLGEGLAFLITVGLLSYIFLGDQPIFRILAYAFIGAAAGYLAAVVLRDVFIHWLARAALRGWVSAWIALALAALLWFQPWGRWGRRLSGVSLAFLTAVSAAVLLGGAARGTLIPLMQQAVQGQTAASVGEHLVGLFITASVLAAFYFGRWPGQLGQRLGRGLRTVGQVFLGLALAAVFVGVYRTALFLLAERLVALTQLMHFIIFGR